MRDPDDYYVPPTEVTKRMAKHEAVRLFHKFKKFVSNPCYSEHVDISIKIPSEGVGHLERGIAKYIQSLPKGKDLPSAAIDEAAKNFANSNDVLCCKSNCATWADMHRTRHDLDMAIYMLQLRAVGWDLVAFGHRDGDCLPVLQEDGEFLLIRDPGCQVVTEVTGLMISAGIEDTVHGEDCLLWDRWSLNPFFVDCKTYLDKQCSWREWIYRILPPTISLGEGEDGDDGNDESDEEDLRWHDSDLLFEAEHGPGSIRIKPNIQAKFILHLLDHTYAMKNNLVIHSQNQANDIANKKDEIERLTEENKDLKAKVAALEKKSTNCVDPLSKVVNNKKSHGSFAEKEDWLASLKEPTLSKDYLVGELRKVGLTCNTPSTGGDVIEALKIEESMKHLVDDNDLDQCAIVTWCQWLRWSRSLSWKLSNGNSEDDAAMQCVDGEFVNPSRGLHRVIEDAKNNGWDVEYVHSDSDSCAWDGKIVMTWRSYTTWVNNLKTNNTQSNLPCSALKRKR